MREEGPGVRLESNKKFGQKGEYLQGCGESWGLLFRRKSEAEASKERLNRVDTRSGSGPQRQRPRGWDRRA